ncbi:hypothetical protein ACQEUU_02205 [Nonomuraea sp. CA-218870]|uniref:hypothetical protein n=1 Tax=Nonomuraea sp. CA-218870 TaxID=3239998 RepID=UPI003D8F1873
MGAESQRCNRGFSHGTFHDASNWPRDPCRSGGRPADARTGPGHPTLDEKVIRAYRERLSSLQEDIDAYESANDLVRLERTRSPRPT